MIEKWLRQIDEERATFFRKQVKENEAIVEEAKIKLGIKEKPASPAKAGSP